MPSSAFSLPPPTLHSLPTRRSSDLSPPTPLPRHSLARSLRLRGWYDLHHSRMRSSFSRACITRFGSACSCSDRREPVTSHFSHSSSRSEEHTSELQSLTNLVCRLLLSPSPPLLSTLSLHDALPIYRHRRHYRAIL